MYKKFEELCNERKITSYQVSKATGIAQSTLSDWKNGRSCPKADKLLALANFFEVPIETFIKSSSN